MMMTNGFGSKVLGSFTQDGLLINILQSHSMNDLAGFS
jgi:hypothetical protein